MTEKEEVRYNSFDRYVCVKGTGYEEELKHIENLYYDNKITLKEFDEKIKNLFKKINEKK